MSSTGKRICRVLLTTVIGLMVVLLSVAEARDQDGPVYVQGLVGAAQFSEDDLTFSETADGDPATSSNNDLSTMPYFGLAVQYPLGEGRDSWGLDGSLLIGLRSRSKSVVAANNQVAIRVDSELWLTDVSAGLYLAHELSGWRTFIAAGPAMLFGEYTDDTDEDDLTVSPAQRKTSSNSESEFGFGAYARAGIEYQLSGTDFVGVCVRGMKTNLEFDNAPEASSDLTAVQAFISFSKYF